MIYTLILILSYSGSYASTAMFGGTYSTQALCVSAGKSVISVANGSGSKFVCVRSK